MAFILFAVGAFLYFTRRFRMGSLQTEGRHVRAAGAVLMMPATLAFILSLIVGMFFSGSQNTLISLIGIMALLEMISLVVAVMVAYILLADPQNAPRLPGILGDIQEERRQNAGASSSQPVQSRPQAAHPLGGPRRISVGTILTVKEAADYMGMTEAAIVDLIESGRLSAARINYTYRIARSNLDELKAQNVTVPAGSL